MNDWEEPAGRPEHAPYVAAVAAALSRSRGLQVRGHEHRTGAYTGRRYATVEVAFGPDVLRLEWNDLDGWRNGRDSEMTRFVDEAVPSPERVTRWALLLFTARHDLYDPGPPADDERDVLRLLARYAGHQAAGVR
ncbi:hypothetical protein [Spirillospora sp. NPDC047279]|uniref:hypothetical protein n=1 Tax=Spirillospora sp. NPDC047279 TaxID=3155478 RepID=UPI0033D78200